MYSWRKGNASWRVGKKLYISVPFTWLMADALKLRDEFKGTVVMGGPAFMEPQTCENFDPLMFHNPCATFTTRGCPNNCPFCAVPRLEPDFIELPDFRPAPVICDNNFLAASKKHIRNVAEKLKPFGFIDFNQGLEARRFTPEIADILAGVKTKIRFAFDHTSQESKLKDAIDICKKRTTKNIGCYVLIGFNDTPDDARYRLDKVLEWGIRPTPMRYQPLDAQEKNTYIADGWTGYELKRMIRYYSRLRWFEHIPYEDFQETGQMKLFRYLEELEGETP